MTKELILYSELNIACFWMIGILMLKTRRSMFLQSQRFLFELVGAANLIFIFSDQLWILMSGGVLPFHRSWGMLFNALYYTFSTLTGFFWFLFVENVEESEIFRNKGKIALAAIPAMIVTFFALVSIRTGWMFFIDADDGEYHRGALQFCQVAAGYGYILYTSVKALYLSQKTSSYQQKNRYRTLAGFVIAPMITGVSQLLIAGTPGLCVGTAIGMLDVYISLQEQLISVDPLTKLNNRNQLYQHLAYRISRHELGEPLYLLMMDGDHFKQINDVYGHIEGDHALQEMAKALCRACRGRHDFICRFGGDEFIIMTGLERGDSIEMLCGRIHHELTRANTDYPITMSIGVAEYSAEMKTGQQFIDAADQQLYEVKRARKPGSGAAQEVK